MRPTPKLTSRRETDLDLSISPFDQISSRRISGTYLETFRESPRLRTPIFKYHFRTSGSVVELKPRAEVVGHLTQTSVSETTTRVNRDPTKNSLSNSLCRILFKPALCDWKSPFHQTQCDSNAPSYWSGLVRRCRRLQSGKPWNHKRVSA
jgi:hypothetical protein